MTFLEWILDKLRNNSEEVETDFDQIPLTIEAPDTRQRQQPSNKEEKEDKRVIIIDT
jgi:hypothetical protein